MTHDDSGRTEGIEPEEAQAVRESPPPVDDTDFEVGSRKPGLPWRRIAVYAGGAVVTVAGTVVATLAATHKTAVHENAKAYAHGMKDAMDVVRSGFDPFDN